MVILTIAFFPKMWYYINVRRGERRKRAEAVAIVDAYGTPPKGLKKIFKKPLDKSIKICYNKDTEKERN